MTTTATLRPRSSVLHFAAEHNPFYLLSAACMLAGCLILTNSLSWNPIALKRLLTLIVTLNAYEAVVIGMALFLAVRRQLPGDARLLLILQAFFLLDFTFLNAEIATLDLRVGVWVIALLFGLALAKFLVIIRVLRPPFPLHQKVFVVAQLLVLFALPLVFRWLDRTSVTPRQFYLAWWMVGLLPALYEILVHLDRPKVLATPPLPWSLAAPRLLYLVLPWISLLTHLGILHYVYDTRFYGANAAPLLLGLTLVFARLTPSPFMGRRDLLAIRVLLPLSAVLVSLNNPHLLGFTVGWDVSLTPLRLALCGAYLVCIYSFFLAYAWPLLGAGAVVVLFWTFGPAIEQVVHWARLAWTWCLAWGQRLIPKTSTAWGVLAVIAAFAFLVLGFALSLTKSVAEPVETKTPR